MKNEKMNVKTVDNNRRRFLKVSGLALAGTGLLMACSNDDDFVPADPDPNPNPDPDPNVFDLGSGNLGILNYAYALEQLEAAFYAKVREGQYYAGTSGTERQLLDDVYYHEAIHREFFKTAISSVVSADQVLPELSFDFSSVDFNSRDVVLATSVALEDTGVSAYNGAGQLIDVSNDAGKAYLGLAGKIVSVEARHASAFRDLVNPGSMDFAGDDILVNLGGTGNSYDKAILPADILAAVGNLGFITTAFTANNLPTS
ncbi:ferritin-like domain-containing protein [Mesonia sp. MT50]|uniref:Ferritin-like domain-containing protein n=1 Tax=Mesonia profundi TaxID=3070998 RepID=A0ABU1A0R4_9FLAO|nr:ferritin-like domain-containing protein [Mesonia profundi]MDQ7916301.1 ferritin-like domain-containing protein [Mesonia profundi]